MHCPECDRPWSGSEGSEAACPDAEGASSALPRCGTCTRPYPDAGAVLLRLLTQLANCGLTAEAPPVLSAVETGS